MKKIIRLAHDPDYGVPLKSRLDFASPKVTLDLKTFTQKRAKPIDKTITDAIFYEQYNLQAYLYSLMRALKDGHGNAQRAPEYVMAFVESDPPHEVRLRALRPTTAGSPNLYWERARVEVRQAIRTYAACVERFGEKPWRAARTVEPLMDEEIPQLAW